MSDLIRQMLAYPDFEQEVAPAEFGAGYLEHRIRGDFRDLCRLIGKENARQEVAEIIAAEFTRRTVEHV
jgi:hypothetical protein